MIGILAGVTPGALGDVTDVGRLPFTTKADLREHYPFGLFAVPLPYLLARLVDLRQPRAVPVAVLVGMLLVLAVTPAASAVSRRYEAEADWVGLRTARDPEAAEQLFVALAAAGKRDPTPPELYTLVFGTHPPILDRIAMAEAYGTRLKMRR